MGTARTGRGRWLTLPIAASLLACAATVAVAARSYRTADTWFVVYKIDGFDQVKCMRGKVLLRRTLPDSGERGLYERTSHRAERVSSLPWPLWTERPRER